MYLSHPTYQVGTSILGKCSGLASSVAAIDCFDLDLNMAAATSSGEGAGSLLSSSNTGPTTSMPSEVRQSESLVNHDIYTIL